MHREKKSGSKLTSLNVKIRTLTREPTLLSLHSTALRPLLRVEGVAGLCGAATLDASSHAQASLCEAQVVAGPSSSG